MIPIGLDMYLEARRYCSDYDFSRTTDRAAFTALKEADPIIGQLSDPQTPSATLSMTVAYWRKANAIHRWFVMNCQEGVDECQDTYVPRSKLVDLLELCRKVLSNRDSADELLPTQGGFFFGPTDYDDWYFASVEHTVERLTSILNLVGPEDHFYSFYYHSSW